jgi:phosphoglycerate dehydrogenase-like enzyme
MRFTSASQTMGRYDPGCFRDTQQTWGAIRPSGTIQQVSRYDRAGSVGRTRVLVFGAGVIGSGYIGRLTATGMKDCSRFG